MNTEFLHKAQMILGPTLNATRWQRELHGKDAKDLADPDHASSASVESCSKSSLMKTWPACSQNAYISIRRVSMHPRLWSNLSESSSIPANIFTIRSTPKSTPSSAVKCDPSIVGRGMANAYNRRQKTTKSLRLKCHRPGGHVSSLSLHALQIKLPMWKSWWLTSLSLEIREDRQSVSPFDDRVCRQELQTSGKKK